MMSKVQASNIAKLRRMITASDLLAQSVVLCVIFSILCNFLPIISANPANRARTRPVPL